MLSFLVKVIMTSMTLNMENKRFIEETNNQNLSYRVGENQFINETYIDEYMDHSSYFMIKKGERGVIRIEEEYVPEEKDWVKENHVSSVKNQGDCGSCWSFSSTGAVESAWSIKKNVLYNLSQQELMDCSMMYGNRGCQGGSMDGAFQYIMKNGICLNLSYPYEGTTDNCRKDECNAVVKIKNYTDIENNNETLLKRVVAKQPVSVAIQANKRSFQLYQSGIYSDLECGTDLDHGVLVVGYGEENEIKYWKVKNSWGSKWGEEGYIRMLRDIESEGGICGIAMNPSIPII